MAKMIVGGRPLDLTAGEVVERLRGHDPEPVRQHFVDIAGSAFPPKQVLAAVTGWDRTTFTTMEAQRVLTRLGFACRRASGPSFPGLGAGADSGEQPRSVEHRLAALESGLAVAQEAIASLTLRLPGPDTTASRLSPQAGAAVPGQNHPMQHQIRDGDGLTMGTENWRLIVAAARALTAAGQAPFSRIAVYQWIWSRHPRAEHDRPTLDPTFQGMIENAPGGPQSAGGMPLRRVARGLYVLAGHPGA